jgi:SCY1-like protein 1
VRPSGDWVLGGFEYTTAIANPDEAERTLAQRDRFALCPDALKSPERVNGDYGLACNVTTVHAIDAFSLGLLIATVFTGNAVNSTSEHKAIADGSARGMEAVPRELRPLLPRLLAATPRSRLSAAQALESPWFKQPLVGALLFLDELALKEPKDKQRFFTSLPGLISRFPASINRHRILPALVRSLQYGAASGNGVNSTAVLGPILDIGATLTTEEYAKEITPCVVKLFASNDRAMRVHLLGALPSFIDKMEDALVNTSIFPSILNGFSDTNAVLREATVKASVQFAPKLSSATFHGVLLKQLKKCLSDVEPGIRVNTTICLGKIAEYANKGSRTEELLACFLRSMRDPVSHTRAAAMRAVAHCMRLGTGNGDAGTISGGGGGTPKASTAAPGLYPFWDADTVAKRIMAAACHLGMDPAGDVRSASHVVLDLGQRQLKEEHERMIKVEAQQAAAAAAAGLQQQQGTGAGAAPDSSMGTASSMASGAVAGAFGWAASLAGLAVSGSIHDPPQASQPHTQQQQPAGYLSDARAASRPQETAVPAAARRVAASDGGVTHSSRAVTGSSNASKPASDGWGASATGGASGWDDDDLDLDDAPVPVANARAARGADGSGVPSGSQARASALGSGSGTRAAAVKTQPKADDGWGADDDFEESSATRASAGSASVARARGTPAKTGGGGTRDFESSSAPSHDAEQKAGPTAAKGKMMTLKGAAKPLEKAGAADGWEDW